MENRSLGERLDAVIRLAGEGRCIADAGCDHGYVCINLIKGGFFERAIAMDLREGPLARAGMNVAANGLSAKIDCRISDGLAALDKDEADTVVVAGMGGALICEIMDREPDKFKALDHFVLQPQSEIGEVRKHLRETGFVITDEDAVKDEGKYYFMFRVSPVSETEAVSEDPDEQGMYDSFGRILIERKNAVLKEWLLREKCVKESILKGLSSGEAKSETGAPDESEIPERILKRRIEVNEDIRLIDLALERME